MAFQFKEKYGNYIGGEFIDPVDGKYFDNITPVNGKVLCRIPRSNEKDINLALDAAHAAKKSLGSNKCNRAQPNLKQDCAGHGR